jgi:hypothetical protein
MCGVLKKYLKSIELELIKDKKMNPSAFLNLSMLGRGALPNPNPEGCWAYHAQQAGNLMPLLGVVVCAGLCSIEYAPLL